MNPFPNPSSQTVIFISSSQVSNMFHQWQFENIWSQSNATFNCSKLNLIDSPSNSCLLKASSIRSWFFRLLNFLWFHPRFDIHFFLKENNWKCLSRFIIDFVPIDIGLNCQGRSDGKNNQRKAFPTVLFCSAISCLISSTIVYILSIYSNTCLLAVRLTLLELYRTCYFLASSTQQIILYPWIILFFLSALWMLSTFKSSQKNSVKLSFLMNTIETASTSKDE